MKEVVILSAVRTPIGKYKGALATVSAADLGAVVIKAALKKAKITGEAVGQVFLGNVLQAGNGQNVARQSAVKAGIPYRVPATTINEVCGSGLKSIILAMQQIQLGEANVVVAGGTENMSQAPKVSKFDYQKNEWQEPFSSMIYDGLMDAFSGEHMGATAEKVALEYQISREQQDQFAFASQKKAAAAAKQGKMAEEIVAVSLSDGTVVSEDEGIRFDASLEKMASLKPAFKEDGTVTAANASTLNDGASALVLASKQYAEVNELPYLAVIDGYSEIGIAPEIMGVSPISAIQRLTEKTQVSLAEIDYFEINEAFAAASVAVQEELKLPSEKVNIYGGGIALGHPIGASGARIVTTLLSELQQEGKMRGIASLCVGGGLGLALMVTKAGNPDKHQGKFYQLTKEQRLAQLVKEQKLSADSALRLAEEVTLPEKIANHLIENAISECSIPLGVAQNFVINGAAMYVPMATEEPSVIAAASNGAKIMARTGGIQTKTLERNMIGQIVLKNVSNFAQVVQQIRAHEALLAEAAKNAYPSIYLRGGGLKSFELRAFEEAGYLSLDVIVDVKDAMGANMLNTMLEGITQELRTLLPNIEILFSILSNYAVRSLVEARCEIPIAMLPQGTAEKIALASEYAKIDIYRAATHNKGIMNGVDAVVLATGNDTRAVAAACHAYAARGGTYQGLSDWEIKGDMLVGKLTLPMAVGTVGGAIKLLPKAEASLKLMGVQHAHELAEIVVAVGLAQNLAALKALVTDGIQKGHMALQSRSLAIAAGATEGEIPLVVRKLKRAERMNLATAAAIIKELRR